MSRPLPARRRGGVLGVALFLVASGLWAGGASEQPSRPGLVASVPPQAWLLKQLVGDDAEVSSIIQPGQDAHTFDPSPREMERLSRASVVFTTGLEFETRIVGTLKKNRPGLEVVDLRSGLKLRSLEAHYHDPSAPHVHEKGNPDPHIWLGPEEVQRQVDTMRAVLLRLFPTKVADIEARHQRLTSQIAAVKRQLDALLEPIRGQTILVYHPAFGYLCDTYDLTQLPIEAGGKEPSPRLLNKSIDEALKRNVSVVFAQPEYEQTAAQAIARALGARVVTVTDLGEDWPELMVGIASAFAQTKPSAR